MVKAKSPAAIQLVARPSMATEIAESQSPNDKASPALTLPAGTGRLAVRRITPSISASYHMFSAPEAPAPSAMNKIAVNPTIGETETGATSRPTSAVNTTSDITRGLSSWM